MLGLALGDRSSSTRGWQSARSCRTSSPRQTVPILAIAPLVVVAIKADWLSVMAVATYLTFFPVTIASLRGLRAVDPRAVELFRSYAATRRQILLAAPAADIGPVPVRRAPGRGRGVDHRRDHRGADGAASGRASGPPSSTTTSTTSLPPEQLWATIVMCTAISLVFFGSINFVEAVVMRGRYRPVEACGRARPVRA